MSNWEWKTDGLYDGDVPILWCARDVNGKLYLGVMADYEDDMRTLPELRAENERLREALRDVMTVLRNELGTAHPDCQCNACKSMRQARAALDGGE